MFEIILASQSPRRRQLLEDAGFLIQVHSLKVSETIEENLNPLDFVTTLAQRKARHFLDANKHLNLQGKIVLAADTVVALDARILGKPSDPQEACDFLRSLSGKMHSVMTGLTLVPDGLWSQQVTAVDATQVFFRPLREDEIQDYVDSGEPMDKAGAYAIQGEGKKFVERFQGSWSNVVGLPMEKLEQIIQQQGWHVRRRES